MSVQMFNSVAAALLSACIPILAFSQDQSAAAHQDRPQTEIDRLVETGAISILESRLRNNTPEELLKLAQAARNAARKEKTPEKRESAFADAEKRYQKLADLLEKSVAGMEPLKRDVERTRALNEWAGMILSAWIAADLDRFELSDGRFGDNKQLAARLAKAVDLYTRASRIVTPLYDDRQKREDEFFALDVAEDIRRLKLDTDFNLGFANLYLGQVLRREGKGADSIAAAERHFQSLVDTGRTGPEMFQVYLGLAVAQREQRKFDAAAKNFNLAAGDGADPVIIIQARYETARSLIAQEKFEEARLLLDPIRQKDPNNLPPDERAAKFHVNLARVWDANSFLLEADSLRRAAENSPARAAILARSRQARETGLTRMNRLAQTGGSWPAIVKLFVADSIKADADPSVLSPLELKIAAAKKSEEKDFAGALKILKLAASRPDLDPEIAPDILFDLGRAHYDLNDLRGAAAAFAELASKHKTHPKAEQAATFAYKCWASVAEDSKDKEDYARLADTLANLISSFPRHPDLSDALWFHAVALQAAGRFDEAVAAFARIPRESTRWEESQFRRALAARQSVESRRDSLSPEQYALEGRKAARLIREYATEARTRSAGLGDKQKTATLDFSAQALIHAAELLSLPGIDRFGDSLEYLADFEKSYGATELLGRVLAARIRAYRGQKDFDNASKVLEQYLKTVATEKAGVVLAGLARGMQEEIDRQLESGRTDDARKMAADAVQIFEQLLASITSDPNRAADAEIVQFGLGRMLHMSGDDARAADIAAQLVARNPRNGNYQRLIASILTAQLADAPSPVDLKRALDAWETLLRDAGLRKRAPQMYWEARYHWLELTLRSGEAPAVENAIRQERVWYPDMGGAAWKPKFDDLYLRAAKAAGLDPATSAPTDTPSASQPHDSAANAEHLP